MKDELNHLKHKFAKIIPRTTFISKKAGSALGPGSGTIISDPNTTGKKSYGSITLVLGTDLDPISMNTDLEALEKGVLRIRDVYPGSRIRIFPSRIRINDFEYFNPKNCFQDLGNIIRVVYLGYGSRILIF
jgi:hypothetical protein